MFEEFSAGYYVGQLNIELSGDDHVVTEWEQHEEANGQVYPKPARASNGWLIRSS